MRKAALKSFAVKARREMISRIRSLANDIAINEGCAASALPESEFDVRFYEKDNGEIVCLSGEAIEQRGAIVCRIKEKAMETGYARAYEIVTEELAYVWFNRLTAMRFLDVNGYIDCCVFDEAGGFDSSEFISVCRQLHDWLPALFQEKGNYTELLFPFSETEGAQIAKRLVTETQRDDFDIKAGGQVEIIGWLYQYYISELKDKVISIYNGVVEKEDIPAATQLFTTEWVVRYMVDNSVGRYYLERNPDSRLREKLEYLTGEIVPVDEEVDVESIRLIDPCMGSGHILAYAFDVFAEMYREQGYSGESIAELILKNNLFGADIDHRAYQLAYFTLMMKARQYDSHIFEKNVTLNITDMPESNDIPEDIGGQLYKLAPDMITKEQAHEIDSICKAFVSAKQNGSLIRVPDCDYEKLLNVLNLVAETCDFGLFDLQIMDEYLPRIIGLCECAIILAGKFEAVVTNPPYLNKYNETLKTFLEENYSSYRRDLFSAFIYRNVSMITDDGYCAMMTPYVWMFIKSYRQLREFIAENKSINSLIQMEYSAFEEATVPICSFVISNKKEQAGTYIRLTDFKGGMDVQAEKVREAIANPECGYVYHAATADFGMIDGTPIAYWVSDNLRKIFENTRLADIAAPRQGLATGDNSRFLRMWYEVDRAKCSFSSCSVQEALNSGCKWFAYNKGGEFRKWYGNDIYVVNWENDGEEIRNFRDRRGKLLSRPQNRAYYFMPCISWSKISSGSIAFRYKPEGFIFDVAGTSVFADEDMLFYLLGFCNSRVAREIAAILSPTLNFEVGHVASFPIIISEKSKIEIEALVNENIRIAKAEWDSYELSWDFQRHPLAGNGNPAYIEKLWTQWESRALYRFNTVKRNEERLNELFTEIYGLNGEINTCVNDSEISLRLADKKKDIKSLLSFAVGAILGRYPYEGANRDNFLIISYETTFSEDIITSLKRWLRDEYGEETLDENLRFISSQLPQRSENPSENIRKYFEKDFFREHCTAYKKRPVYLMLEIGEIKGLIYYHKIDSSTFDTIQNRYISAMSPDKKLCALGCDLDTDNGIRENLKRLQTDRDGNFVGVFAKIPD